MGDIYTAPAGHRCDPDGYELDGPAYEAREQLGAGSIWRCDHCQRDWVKESDDCWRPVHWWKFRARRRIRDAELAAAMRRHPAGGGR